MQGGLFLSNELKKAFRAKSLNCKNDNEFSKEHFQNINNSYLYIHLYLYNHLY